MWMNFWEYSGVRIKGTPNKRNFMIRGTFVLVPFLVLLCLFWILNHIRIGETALKTLLHPALAAIMCFCLCLRSSVCVPWSKHVTWSCASRVSKNILSFDARNNPPANFPVWRIEIFHEKKSKNKDKICEAHGTRIADHLHWRQTP